MRGPCCWRACGRAAQVVTDGEVGILEEVGDVEKMGRRLSELLGDPEALSRMGRAGRRRVEETFRTDRVVPDYEALYRRVLENPSPQQ